MDQDKTGFVLADGGLALAFEAGIKQSKLPSRRWSASHNSIAAAEEVKVFSLISYVVKSRQARTDVEVHMREEAVLRYVEAYADRAGVSLSNLKIDVTHG
jgi:hypothetical protein